jgi:hypothetical protein
MDTSDKTKNWHLQWDMDGCQWDVLGITMYEEFPPKGYSMHTQDWVGCLMFVYKHLMRSEYTVKDMTIYCSDGKFIMTKDVLTDILKQHYPEEFI